MEVPYRPQKSLCMVGSIFLERNSLKTNKTEDKNASVIF